MPVGQVGDPHRRVGGVHGLPAGTGRAEHVDPQVVRVDRRHRRPRPRAARARRRPRCGSGPATRSTGTRCTRCTPPSYFSRAQTPSGVGARRLDRDRDVLVAAEVGLGGARHLGLPAAPLGVPQVHPQQVAGEQRRLLAALPGLDLDDHVLVVVRVAREQQLAQPGLELGAPGGQLGRPRRRTTASSAASSRAASRSPRAASQLAARSHDRGQLGVPAAEPAGQRLVGVHGRVGQLLLELGVLGEQLGDGARARRSSRGRHRRRPAGSGHNKRRPPTAAGRRAPSGATCRLRLRLPYRASKRATRPPVSRIFCLPV